jgi:hypothetical protein
MNASATIVALAAKPPGPSRPLPETGAPENRHRIETRARSFGPFPGETAMHSNVIAFATNAAARPCRAATQAAAARNNVIELAAWIGRAMPRRTPNGVFFTTHVLASPGDIA